MVKVKTTKKDRQYNGQCKKDKGTNNTMVKVKTTKKDRQYNGQSKNHKEGQTIQWSK